MKEDLVSIIMPSWNTANYIGESIESVINQTYKNWELIIVDDNSSDDTDKVINKFKDKRIKFFKNNKNLGAALTRNRALREAKGEWIAFLDSDDLWSERKIEFQINYMNENGYTFSYHNYEKIDENSSPLGIYVTGPRKITKQKMYQYGYPGCLTFMYSRRKHGLIQIKDIKKNNDYAILLNLIENDVCFLLDKNLAFYRIRKNSISHDKLLKKIKSHYDLFRYCANKSPVAASMYTVQNMFFGILKKLTYEKKKGNYELNSHKSN